MTRRLSALPHAHGTAVALAALHGICFPEDPWDAAAIAEILRMPSAFGVAVWEDDDPVGFALALDLRGDGEILSLAILPPQRRRGLGSTLLRALAGEAQRRGATALFLEVAEDNPAALALYRKHDFVEVGRRPKYYHRAGGFSDARILRRSLADAPASS